MKKTITILYSLLFLLAIHVDLNAQKHQDPVKEISKDIKHVNKEVSKDVNKNSMEVNKDFSHVFREVSKDFKQVLQQLRSGNISKKSNIGKSISKSEASVSHSYKKIETARRELDADKNRLSKEDYLAKKSRIDAAEAKTKELEISINKGKIKIK